MGKQQITKSWGEGLPRLAGRYILANFDYTEPRFITAVNTGNAVVMFDVAGEQINNGDGMVHFGPIPSIERSLSAQERRSAITVAN